MISSISCYERHANTNKCLTRLRQCDVVFSSYSELCLWLVRVFFANVWWLLFCSGIRLDLIVIEIWNLFSSFPQTQTSKNDLWKTTFVQRLLIFEQYVIRLLLEGFPVRASVVFRTSAINPCFHRSQNRVNIYPAPELPAG